MLSHLPDGNGITTFHLEIISNNAKDNVIIFSFGLLIYENLLDIERLHYITCFCENLKIYVAWLRWLFLGCVQNKLVCCDRYLSWKQEPINHQWNQLIITSLTVTVVCLFQSNPEEKNNTCSKQWQLCVYSSQTQKNNYFNTCSQISST